MSQSEYIIIVGCGRLGSVLANELSATGHRLVVIDIEEASFDSLSTEFSGYKIIGDAIEVNVLRRANLEEADFLFAMTTQDNVNLMVAQIARKIFHVPHVVARVFDPAREAVYQEFGIDTISPTKLAADAFMEMFHTRGERAANGARHHHRR